MLCKNGHLTCPDAYEYGGCCEFEWEGEIEEWKCPHCAEGVVWENLVDLTNGSFWYDPKTNKEERIDGYVKLEIKELNKCTCKECGVIHQSKPFVYVIPEKKK